MRSTLENKDGVVSAFINSSEDAYLVDRAYELFSDILDSYLEQGKELEIEVLFKVRNTRDHMPIN